MKHKNMSGASSFSDINYVYLTVDSEMQRGMTEHGLFNSPHELYGVLCKQMDQFWDSVKADEVDAYQLIQLAAVAIAGAHWLGLDAEHNEEKDNEGSIG